MRPSPLERWALSPALVHLNHGSFGGCLRSVLRVAAALRDRLEEAPMRFLVLEWQTELDRARAAAAAFLRTDASHLVFVPNSTSGVATALRAVTLTAGDEIVTTTHTYAACRHQLARLADATGARIVAVPVAHPFEPDALVAEVSAAITSRTRLALFDHVTSPTALVFPIARMIAPLAARQIPIIIDGAHAPGQLDLDVGALLAAGVTWYVGNFHKWVCAPKASAFLATAPHAADRTLPLVTSHGASAAHGPPNRLHAEHDWSGTYDPSAQLAVPAAIADVGAEGGGWSALRARNHALVLAMGERLGGPRLAPDDARGAMLTVPLALPAGMRPLALEAQLLAEGYEVPIVDSLVGPLLRVSAHLYNHVDQIEPLVAQLHAHGVRISR